MRHLTCLAAIAALAGCGGGERDNRTVTASDAKTNATEGFEVTCDDCDGGEGLVFNAKIAAMNEAYEACGGPIEPIANSGGISPEDYRCRQQARKDAE